VSTALDLITTYAITRVPDVRLDPSKVTDFIQACHVGFAKAQDLILTELLSIEDDKRFLKEQKRRDKTRLLEELFDYYYLVFRKLADAIAWQLIGMSDFMARRLHVSHEQPHLSSSNYGSVKTYVDDFNRQHPLGFALMTDLTSFVRMGDVLQLQEGTEGRGTLHFIELKEGAVNAEMLETVDLILNHPCSRFGCLLLMDYDEKRREHAMRLMKQLTRNVKSTILMNEGDGIDPLDNAPHSVVELPIEYASYDEVLDELVSRARQHGSASTVIDGCLHLAARSVGPRHGGSWETWVKGLPHSNTLVGPESLRTGFRLPLAHPLFVRNLTRDNILDITSQTIVLMMILDVDRFLDLAHAEGARGYWGPKASGTAEKGLAPILSRDGRPALIEYAGKQAELIGWNVATILHNGVTPQSFLKGMVSLLEAI
jgi:hypothetical protein